MKYSQRIIFGMLSLFALSSAAFAKPAQINGKELDSVDDIMAEANVYHEFPKESLFMFRKDNNGYHGTILTFSNNGNVLTSYDPVAQPNPGTSVLSDWNGGIYPVVTSGDSKLNHRILIPTAMNRSSGTRFHVTGFSFNGSVALQSDDFKNLTSGISGNSSDYSNAVVTDAKGGLFPVGTDKEFVAAGIVRNVRGGNPSSAIVAFADGENPTELQIPVVGNQNSAYYNQRDKEASFITTRVAVGDFDYDGRRDEIAVRYINGDDGDEDDDFHSQVRFYKVRYSGNKLHLDQLVDFSASATTHGRIEAAALVTGDFDGDGNEEVALVEGDISDHARGNDRSYPSVEIFKKSYSWYKEYATSWSDSNYQLSDPGKGNEYRVWGLQAAAGDIDGDSKDEIIVLAVHGDDYSKPGTVFISVWKCESGITPKIIYSKDLDDAKFALKDMQYDDNDDAMYWSQRTLSIVAAPFTGQINGVNSVCDLVVSMAGTGGHGEASRQRVWILSPVIVNGKFSSFSNPEKIFEDSNVGTVGLAAFDFAGEVLKLGDPEHIKIEGHKNYSVILKTPPYHIDYVKVPWEPDKPAAVRNFGYLGRYVQYTTKNNQTNENLVTSKTQHAVEGGLNFKFGASSSMSFGKWATLGIASGRVKAAGNIGLGASGGFTKTTDNSDKETTSHTLGTSLKTETTDVLMYTAADYHIWRYPVIQPAPIWVYESIEADNGLLEDDTTELTNDFFITYTLCDEASDHTCDSNSSSQYDDYNPPYEEGNLFSYPDAVSYGYGKNDVQATLTGENSFMLTVNEQKDLIFNNSGSSSEKVTTSWKVGATADIQIDSNLDLNIGFAKGPGASVDVSISQGLYGKYAYEATDGTTSTKSWSNTEQVTINAPTSSLSENKTDVNYTTYSQVFVDAAGALTTPFAVNFDEGAWMWNYNMRESEQSPYVVSSDPALVLPMRYSLEATRTQEGVTYTYWNFSRNESNATKMRGVKFYDKVTKQYVSGVLEKGFTYEITVPIYNASFVDAGGVVVEYGYQKIETDSSGRPTVGERVLLGRQTIELKGWKNGAETAKGGRNKANLVFEWTPEIPVGDYDLYVILDPDDEIKEVHENWTHETRDGNNNGYRPIAIVDTIKDDDDITNASVPFIRYALRAAEGNEKVTDENFTLKFYDVNNESHGAMTASELRSYILSRKENVEIRGFAEYTGSEVLTNVNVEFLCKPLNDEPTRVIASRRILALRPGRNREFYFTANPDKIGERHFEIRLSCSQGAFNYEGGSGRVDNDNNGGSDDVKLGSSGGGCEVGISSLGMLALLGLALCRRK